MRLRGSSVVAIVALTCTASRGPSTANETLPVSSGIADDPGVATYGTVLLDVGHGSGGLLEGCAAVDLLFVIDNSESMETYQRGLAEAFPGFIAATFEALPRGTSIHVALTTSDFDSGCDAAETTQNCQSSSSLEDVRTHFRDPTQDHDGGNGSQGRLFEYAGRRYFEATTDDDPSALQRWFSEAAVAAGEDGCSFEMPVAAAGFTTHPVNMRHNFGFLRDEGALLVVFFLTDEPDKSAESERAYAQMLFDAKAACGGADCIFAAGLIPTCTAAINQKLWQFMHSIGGERPRWQDIQDTMAYDGLVGRALADALAEACASIPVG